MGAVLSACSIGAQPSAGNLKPVTLVVGTPALDAANAYVTIAKELGYFVEEGLDVTLQTSQGGGAAATQLLASGGANVGVFFFTPMLGAISEGNDPGLLFFCNVGRDGGGDHAVVAGDSPISTYEGLKGKKIGVLSLTDSSLQIIEAHLASVGVDPDRDVEFIAVGRGAQAGLALQNGEIDALYDTDQALAATEAEGFDFKSLPSIEISERASGSAAAMRKVDFDADPETARKISRALIKGVVFLLENPEAGIQVHWKAAPESKPTGVESDQEALEETLVPVLARLPSYEIEGETDPRWCAFAEEDVKSQIEFAGLNVPTPMDYFTNQFVDEVNGIDFAPIREQAKNWKP